MNEWVLVNDEGVIEDGFFSREEAEFALAKSDPEDELSIDLAAYYDEDGNWIEEPDGEESR